VVAWFKAQCTQTRANAMDACVGGLPVTTSGSVNVNIPGIHILTYTATISGGNSTTAQTNGHGNASQRDREGRHSSIIPLPVTLSNLAGIFTLCPPQPTPPAPSHALIKILVDDASQQTGQYLAAALFKSTGYQFQVAAALQPTPSRKRF